MKETASRTSAENRVGRWVVTWVTVVLVLGLVWLVAGWPHGQRDLPKLLRDSAQRLLDETKRRPGDANAG